MPVILLTTMTVYKLEKQRAKKLFVTEIYQNGTHKSKLSFDQFSYLHKTLCCYEQVCSLPSSPYLFVSSEISERNIC